MRAGGPASLQKQIPHSDLAGVHAAQQDRVLSEGDQGTGLAEQAVPAAVAE